MRAVRGAYVNLMLAVALGLAGCGPQQTARPTPAPAPLKNAIAFPLYPGAKVISISDFRQAVNGKTYAGHEVIAATPASFVDLAHWIASLEARPPAGYQHLENESARSHAQAHGYGFDYATFRKGAGTDAPAVLAVAIDPQRVRARFGTVLMLVAHYNSLPAVMRRSIDDQVKARLGVTLSELLEPNNPIGVALSALDRFGQRDSRGIVLLYTTLSRYPRS